MEQEIAEIKLDNSTDSPLTKATPKENGGYLTEVNNGSNGMKSKKIGLIAGIIIGGLVLLGSLVGIPAYRVYKDGMKVYALALGIKDAAKSQDIKQTTEAIVATKTQLAKVQSDLGALAWTRFIPLVGSYTSDAIHLTNAGQAGLEAAEIFSRAVEPYADILGLKGQGTFTGGTTEERLAKVVETLDKVTSEMDKVADKMAIVQKEVDAVDPSRYPETFQGEAVRSKIVELKSIVDISGELFTEARPMIKKLPVMLGAEKPSRYMVLFQNDAELRPTGGFLTAYAVFSIDKGKIHLEASDDIYKLDDTVTRRPTPPEPIKRILNEGIWYLRNANFSPDYAISMQDFENMYNSSAAKQNIDGIIAVDTHVLISMMDVLGPIAIYGTNFTTQKVPGCDCPMVIYELEKYADEPKAYERGSRKDIIGVLLSELMKKGLGAPKQVYGKLFQAMIDESKQKHILYYLHDADAQKGIEALGFGGKIRTYNGDYLHINDANLAGAKSNLYIVPTVKQEVSITDGGASEKLTIQYRYPHAADNCSLERKAGLCLAGIYRDYVRVYLPAGAVVSEAKGFETKSNTFSDLGHSVVDGYFTVVPQGLANIQITYSVNGDFKKTGEYRSLIQKQPGTVGNSYTVTVNGKSEKFNLVEDRELTIKL